MTKRLWLIACLCLAALTSLADEEKIVRLSDDNKQELLQLGPCNILIVKGETEDGSSAPVTIEIENMQEDEALILFHRSYTEKDLKKSFTPQTTFNKQFPGGSAAHVITKCEELENDVFIRPTDKALLPVSLKATSDEPVKPRPREPLQLVSQGNREEELLQQSQACKFHRGPGGALHQSYQGNGPRNR